MSKFKSKFLQEVESNQDDSNRGPVHLYLDKDLYKQFKESIGKLAISVVIEKFMRDIVETEKGIKRK